MSTPILTTKLFIPPPRDGLVRRLRLIERLQEGVKRKLALVSAPAGFGKTTLLSTWIEDVDLPVAWLTLEPRDNDATRFWAYLITALRTARPGMGETALAILQSPQPFDRELMLTSLINEIAATPVPFILILDDYHVIESQTVHRGLSFLVEHLPSEMHIIIATRSDPPLPLGRLRSQDRLLELRTVDLRFTIDEVASFLNETMGLKLSPEEVFALEARTEGWIAGLQMAAISLREQQRAHGNVGMSEFIETFTGSHRFVMDYLVEEVLNQQPVEIREFLLRTSILSRFNALLGDAVLGRDDSSRITDRLDRANLFLVPLDEDRNWYRYHHLFADLLQRKLGGSAPDIVPDLHRRASEWYAEHNFLEDAIHHAIAIPDFERAAVWIERIGVGMIERGELVTLESWLDTLPKAKVRTRSWLSVFRAWVRYYLGPRDQVEGVLHDVERTLALDISLPLVEKERGNQEITDRTDAQHIHGHVAALRAYMALQHGELDQVAFFARQALDDLPVGDFARTTSAIALAETFRANADLSGWYEAYAQARRTALECQNLPMAVSATTYMGDQLLKQGRLPEAAEMYVEALELASGPGETEIPAAGLPRVKWGNLLREWNDLATARANLSRGIELCIKWGHTDSMVIGYVTLARVCLAEGDFKAAHQALRKAEDLVSRTDVDPWAVSLTDDCRLRIWLEEGNLAAAERWIDQSGLDVTDELDFLRDLEHICLARVLVAKGSKNPLGKTMEKALFLLERLKEKTEDVGWTDKLIGILVLQALALHAQRQKDQALSTLEEAVTLAMPGGYVRIFVDEGLPMAHLLKQVLARGVRPDYVHGLLTAISDVSTERRSKREVPTYGLIEPLTPRELDVLELIAQGFTNREIGQQLSIALGTVKRHIANIYGKLAVHNRTQAVARARELGFL